MVNRLHVAAFAACLFVLATPAVAQEGDTQPAPTTPVPTTSGPVQTAPAAASLPPAPAEPAPAVAPPPASDPFQQVIAARHVADFARRQRDPYAMLSAARMLQEVRFTDEGAAAPAAGEDPNAAFTPSALFAEAKALAKGDQQLLMQINVAQSTGSRGVLSSAFGRGLVRLVQELGGQAGYRFNVKAKGGEPLRIGAIGDLGTAILIRLVDSAGRLVCLDDNNDYAPVCAISPRAGGDYRVEIVNRSKARSRTVILSN